MKRMGEGLCDLNMINFIRPIIDLDRIPMIGVMTMSDLRSSINQAFLEGKSEPKKISYYDQVKRKYKKIDISSFTPVLLSTRDNFDKIVYYASDDRKVYPFYDSEYDIHLPKELTFVLENEFFHGKLLSRFLDEDRYYKSILYMSALRDCKLEYLMGNIYVQDDLFTPIQDLTPAHVVFVRYNIDEENCKYDLLYLYDDCKYAYNPNLITTDKIYIETE